MDEKLFEEGQRALKTEKKQSSAKEKERLEIDARKMIIYSELLKPKFDEGLN